MTSSLWFLLLIYLIDSLYISDMKNRMTSSVSDETKNDGAEPRKFTKKEKKAVQLVQRNFKKYKARKLMYAMVQGKFMKI